MRSRPILLARALLWIGAFLAAGCASIDWDAPKPPSTTLAARPSPALAAALEAHPGQSGFLLLEEGIEAFAARLLMAERARVSIDAQYYFILNDVTGHAFFRRLLAAADRGVRVRLLLDDIATQGYDPGLAALDAHPHFEVRIFNPFTRSRGRVFSGVSEFRRVNRRMHNKSLIVDGIGAVIGGRNIGAEYFAAREDVNFGDLDVLGIGPVGEEAGRAFDEYWNSEAAVPIRVLTEPPEDPQRALSELREGLDASTATLARSRYSAALQSTLLEQIELRPDSLTWAPARVVYDAPEKSRTATEGDDPVANELRAPLRKAVAGAESELLVVSPYFVPLESGVAGLCGLREGGARVVVLTNSLASTDVAAVHAGYAPYREDLLACGVELFEMRPDIELRGTKRGGVGMSRSSLHAKGFVVDRETLFVGSFNWDPRSAAINTEMGVLLRSPAFARRLAEELDTRLPQGAYRVVLDDGEIRWIALEDGLEVVYDTEPEAGLWERFSAGLLEWLPIRGQL